jgi:multiple sugar transport system substrate-binding protein
MRNLLLVGATACLSICGWATSATADITVTYPTGWEELLEPAFRQFESETGEKVVSVVVPKDIDQRLVVDFAGGAASDVVVYDSYRTSEYTESGYLADLTAYAEKWEDWPHYFGSLKEISTISGVVRGIPNYTDVRMLWYNRAIFEQAGIEQPWKPATWSDVLAAAEKIKAAAPKVEYPLYFPVGTKMGEATTMQGFYMALLGADRSEGGRNRLRDWEKGLWIGDSPAIRKVLGLYQEIFVNRGLSARELYYTPDVWGDMRRAFADGKIGIMAGGSWEYRSIWRAVGTEKSPDEIDAFMAWAPFPGDGTEGAPLFSNISGGWNFGISEQSSQKDLAWKLVETILDGPKYAAWVAKQGRVAVRRDALEAPDYKANAYLTSLSPLLESTTGRDTYPGYSSVSAFIQEATAAILDGKSIDDVVATYRKSLEDEFGASKVTVIE